MVLLQWWEKLHWWILSHSVAIESSLYLIEAQLQYMIDFFPSPPSPPSVIYDIYEIHGHNRGDGKLFSDKAELNGSKQVIYIQGIIKAEKIVHFNQQYTGNMHCKNKYYQHFKQNITASIELLTFSNYKTEALDWY